WQKFENSIASVQFHTRTIDGFVGEHLKQMSKLMFDLGNGLHTNFLGSWEKRIGGKSIALQLSFAIEAFRELRNSLYLIENIHRGGERNAPRTMFER
ncbi:hypothetical protein PMAYCL1PPCAC_22410, partial [Pristionchus mayeri]